jgi:hypothetical protein
MQRETDSSSVINGLPTSIVLFNDTVILRVLPSKTKQSKTKQSKAKQNKRKHDQGKRPSMS